MLATTYGDLYLIVYESSLDDLEHIALVKGSVAGCSHVPVRVHSECITGDIFGSLRCDCGEQLDESLRMIEAHDVGVFVYLRQEGRGIGLVNKIKSYELQDSGLDTFDANLRLGFDPDPREYDVAALILKDLDVSTVRLITNNPKKRFGLEKNGIGVTERIPLVIPSNPHNEQYLKTKQSRFGHLLDRGSLNRNKA